VSLLPKIQYENLNHKQPKVMLTRQGDVSITPAGYSQHWRWLSPFAAANLFIPPSLITEISQDLVKGDTDLVSLIECNVKSTAFLSASVLELISQLEAGSGHGKIYVDALTRSLVMYLIMHHSTAKFAESRGLTKPDNPRVACAIDFIESHLGEDLSLAAGASHLAAI